MSEAPNFKTEDVAAILEGKRLSIEAKDVQQIRFELAQGTRRNINITFQTDEGQEVILSEMPYVSLAMHFHGRLKNLLSGKWLEVNRGLRLVEGESAAA